MPIHTFVILFLAFTGIPAGNANQPNTGEIQVKVTGMKNDRGELGILLFNKATGFPSESDQAYKQVLIPANKTTYTFTDVPHGSYAVAVMHDENANKKLDVNFLGIPKEGYGVSNNATGVMGPPKFIDALFALNEKSITTEIKLNY